jgi:hypothetical protein
MLVQIQFLDRLVLARQQAGVRENKCDATQEQFSVPVHI